MVIFLRRVAMYTENKDKVTRRVLGSAFVSALQRPCRPFVKPIAKGFDTGVKGVRKGRRMEES